MFNSYLTSGIEFISNSRNDLHLSCLVLYFPKLRVQILTLAVDLTAVYKYDIGRMNDL